MIKHLLGLGPLMIGVFMSITISGLSQQSLFTQYKFHRLDELNGLTNNVVNDIIQDSLGQIWVATNEGLFRYQGFGFQQFIKNRKHPEALPNNFIGQLFLDRDNQVWILTDDGVGRYSYQNDVIKRYLPDQIKGRISSMACDKDGNFYFSKLESGIVKVVDGQAIPLDLYDEVSGKNFNYLSVTEMVINGDKLWASIGIDGVICYNLENKSIVFFSVQEIMGRPFSKSFDLQLNDRNSVWLGTESGVYALHLNHDGSKRIDSSLARLLPDDDYLTIFAEAQLQRLWVGSRQNGMFLLAKNDDGHYERIQHFSPSLDEYGVSHRTISKIYQQKDGAFWLGTHNGGINIFNPQGETVRMITKRANDSPYSINYQSVWGICESSDGNVWIGTDGKGIGILHTADGTIQNSVIPGLADKAILCSHEDTQGRLWMGTYAHGVFLYDTKTGALTNFSRGAPNSELLVNDIRSLYEDSRGNIYIGANQGGLYYYDESERRIKRAVNVPTFDIRSIESVEEGVLWLGTFGQGLQKYSVAQQRLLNTVWQEVEPYARAVVYDIANDAGLFWIGTRHNGLVVFDPRKEVFLKLPLLDILVDRLISGVQLDGAQNVWFSTNSGVVIYNRDKEELQEFGAEDGFQVGHFNNGAIIYSQKYGYMVLGGIHGMNIFYPDELISRPYKENIIFNQLVVNDKVVTPENSKVFPDGQSIFLTDAIHLSHSDNVFSLQFALPGFSTQSEKDYVYRLEGYESQWHEDAESNQATYQNVPPGNYTFQVKSLKGDSWQSLLVIIHPPFWRTWPAYLLYTFVILFLIWQWNKFNSSRIALKQKLQFEQELREREHFIMQEKLRFYTNFSHELKTPLTLIQGPVNDLLKTVTDAQQRQYLKLIRKNTGLLLKFIRRMLEFRKIELNKTVLNVGKHDIKILAQEEAESFGYLAREYEVKFGFYCVNDLEAWVDLEKIQIIINNLLSNAFKFTPKGKKVNFGVFEEGDDLVIEVKDEGLGIRSEDMDNIFSPFFQGRNTYSTGGTGIGLTLCKSLVELHEGTIALESQEGKGTRVLVTIPKGKAKFEGKDFIRFIEVGEELSVLPEEEIMPDIPEGQPSDNEKLLLIVDDNKDITAYVKTIFAQEYKVLIADNGIAAYDLAVNHTPDIIISDIMMPGMDGVAFCRKIKATMSTSHIPVIMLTAKSSKQDKINSYEVGADEYITKPFASDLLAARVNNLLKSRKMLELRYEANELVDPQSEQNAREVAFVLQTEEVILRMLEQSDFDIPMLCKELGMSQSALYRKIKSLTGHSIQVFIKRIRMKRAAQLLLSEDMTVTEIAFSLNFSDLKYFRKCFKEQFEMTPSEYRTSFGPKPGDVSIAIDAI